MKNIASRSAGFIEAWDEVRRIDGLFEDVETRVAALGEDEANTLRGRLKLARELIGEADPLRRLR